MKCPESVFYITTIIVRHSTRTGRSLSTGLSTLGRYCRRFWEGRGNFLDLSPTTHHHRLALRLARLRQEAEVEAGVAQGGSTAWDHQRHRLPALSCRRVFPRDLPRDVPFWYHSTRAMPVATQECRPFRRSLQHWLVRTDLHTTPTACKAPSCRDHCFFA